MLVSRTPARAIVSFAPRTFAVMIAVLAAIAIPAAAGTSVVATSGPGPGAPETGDGGANAVVAQGPAQASSTTSKAMIGVSVQIEKPSGIGATVDPRCDDEGIEFSEDALYFQSLNPCTDGTTEASFQVTLSGIGLYSESVSWSDLTGVAGSEAQGHVLPNSRLTVFRKVGPPQPIWSQISNGWQTQLRLDGELQQHFKAVLGTNWQDSPGQYAGALDVSVEQR